MTETARFDGKAFRVLRDLMTKQGIKILDDGTVLAGDGSPLSRVEGVELTDDSFTFTAVTTYAVERVHNKLCVHLANAVDPMADTVEIEIDD